MQLISHTRTCLFVRSGGKLSNNNVNWCLTFAHHMTSNEGFAPKSLFVPNIVPSAALNKQLFTSSPATLCVVAISAVAYLHARRRDCFHILWFRSELLCVCQNRKQPHLVSLIFFFCLHSCENSSVPQNLFTLQKKYLAYLRFLMSFFMLYFYLFPL